MTQQHPQEPNEEDIDSATIAMENALSGYSFDLVQLASKSNSSESVQKYLDDRQLTLNHFVGVVIAAHSESAVDTACECIAAICKAAGLASESQMALLSDGLTHPLARVRILVLRLLAADASSERAQTRLQLAPLIIDCLDFADSAVASAASALLLATADTHLSQLISPDNVSLLTSLFHTSSDTVSLRVCELVISMAAQASPSDMHALEATGVFESMITEPLDSTDIMKRLNTIEILTRLQSTTSGFQFLDRTAVLTRISQYMRAYERANEDIDTLLSLTASIKFFAKLALALGANSDSALGLVEDAYGFIQTIQTLLTTEEVDVRLDVKETCLYAIGNVGSSRPGLILLSSHYTQSLDAVVEAARRGTGTIRVVACEALSCILDNDAADARVSGESSRLFRDVGGCLFFLAMIQSFDEALRVAGYACLKAISTYDWGLKALRESGQLVAFMLDRSNEKSELGMKWRFSVMESIARNAAAKEILREELFNRFVKYAKEGPFYSESQPMVMMASM
ncbi:hypothetical protein HDU77_006978 [Chytriomyces hyalinus]|nr:hypothetical protein HDU77_006978 [Chytriomyces hyalinus]